MAYPIVQMKTELGEINIEIYEKQAPITSKNFLHYVDDKLYDGTTFFRTVTMDNQPTKEQPTTVKILVIQGGQVDKTKEYPPIELETTKKTGLRHLAGAISMSRMKPGSSTSSFFLCIRDEPDLDFGGSRNSDGMGFAAFGRVISGMEVVKKIHSQPKEGQRVTSPIEIISVSRSK
jgi:peptidyl-prolyl cis-trans isomerase A (cyclophilin A)